MKGFRCVDWGSPYVVVDRKTDKPVSDAFVVFPRQDRDAVEVVRKCEGSDKFVRELDVYWQDIKEEE